MSGDGVSLQTNLVQLGNVAKTQPRSQQSATTGPGFAEQLDKKDDLRPQRVKEPEKTEREQVDPEGHPDHKGKRKPGSDAEAELLADAEEAPDDPAAEAEGGPEVGRLIDTKA